MIRLWAMHDVPPLSCILRQANEQVTQVNTTVATAVKRIQRLKTQSELLKKEAKQIRTEQTTRIEEYRRKEQEFQKMQKSNDVGSEIDNTRVDRATAQFRLKQRKQARAQKAANAAQESEFAAVDSALIDCL